MTKIYQIMDTGSDNVKYVKLTSSQVAFIKWLENEGFLCVDTRFEPSELPSIAEFPEE